MTVSIYPGRRGPRTGIAVVLFALMSCPLVDAAEQSTRVSIETGQLQGVVAGDVTAYKGVPFAAPPVGDLRWRAPQSATKWQGLRSAATYGADCMQVGATDADIGFVTGRTLDELFAPFGPDALRARAVYDPEGSSNVRVVAARIGGDQMMIEPARQVACVLAGRGQSVYQFRFSYVAESMRKTWAGAPHATDIPFVFNTVAARYGKDLTASDAAMGKAAIDYWTSFAKTGRPVAAGHPAWPAYDSRKDLILDFSNAGPVVVADRWQSRLDLAEGVNKAKEAPRP